MQTIAGTSARSSKNGLGAVAWAGLALGLVFALLFGRALQHGVVLFSNDGPLGAIAAEQMSLPAWFTGAWQDLNWLGANNGVRDIGPSALLFWALGPVGFAKTYTPFSLLLLGLGATYCFRRFGLSPVAGILGGLAAALASNFFSTACWGLGGHCINCGLCFIAMGLLADSKSRGRWMRVMLAGMAVGFGVIEGADIGALFSILVAVWFAYNAWFEFEGTLARRLVVGGAQLLLVVACAGLIASQMVVNMVGTQIQGVSGTAQDAQTKSEKWDWATQWSLPKKEALGVVVPGLYGYRMDTPGGGQYWGGIGRTPGWEQHHQGFPRYAGSGYYLGVSVAMIAIWAAVQGWRRKQSVFGPGHRRQVWFWSSVAVVSLLFAFGRHAPFYQFLYKLPYFSTIRNPTKFMHFFSMAMVVLFALGVDGLWRTYLAGIQNRSPLNGWWKRCGGFERRWILGSAVAVAASLLGWLIYASSRVSMERYLASVGFDASLAELTAGFSIRQVGWFVLFLALTVALLALMFGGFLSGSRAKWGGLLLGAVMVLDLAMANLPWIVVWDYQYKYAANPVIEFLKDKPYEHRVAGLPFRAPQQLSLGEQVYRIEWMQHHFQYYNIQSLDIVQMSREPVDFAAYEGALRFDGTPATLPLITRRWQLTNTRYLIGPAGFLDVLNTQVDPDLHRFEYALRYNLEPKPGVTKPSQLTDLTAVPATNGDYAVFEFSGALPRAKLYSQWQTSTNDQEVLKRLADPRFDPEATVLVSGSFPESAAGGGAGSVEFVSYAPKKVLLKTHADGPTVLLLNDRYDPNWKVLVDGTATPLLRCNYIMRGVHLTPGQHEVQFVFQPPMRFMYVSLAAMSLGVVLVLVLSVLSLLPQMPKAEPVR